MTASDCAPLARRVQREAAAFITVARYLWMQLNQYLDDGRDACSLKLMTFSGRLVQLMRIRRRRSKRCGQFVSPSDS